MQKAVIYCRSSKDRAEVGLDTQRKELKAFARQRDLAIVGEFSDMEISGSLDEVSRPGLSSMLAELRAPSRQWSVILALDTSRIARDPMLGLYVTREAEKAGVRIEYAKMPVDGSSAFGETMLSVVRAFDRLHARLSAEKGRGGLAANVEKGYRAGGAAPFGYKLQHEETGATRGGVAVRKSRLVVDKPAAKKVQAFLQSRAAGTSRSVSAKECGLQSKAVASLIAIERNALTYAGFTVWNQRRKVKPTREDPRKTMEWRPRSEWLISEEQTHEALITREEAERILAQHETRAKRPRVCKPEDFILSGLLFTPDGRQWTGDAHDRAYRVRKGKRINAPWVEGEVIMQVASDIRNPAFLTGVVKEARRMAKGIEADPAQLDSDMRRCQKRLNNLVDLLADSGDRLLLAKMKETEQELSRLREAKASWVERSELKARLMEINEEEIRFALLVSGAELRDGAGSWEGEFGFGAQHRIEPDQLRKVLTALVERIELDPETRKISVYYRLPLFKKTGAKVASPRGFEPRLSP